MEARGRPGYRHILDARLRPKVGPWAEEGEESTDHPAMQRVDDEWTGARVREEVTSSCWQRL